MKYKISIIVPIYKIENELIRCVESIREQTFKDIEIILVDDESPDNCPDICEKLALQDSRIKVIHKKNGGLSDARNAGLKIATGEYVLFVDGDDYIKEDTCYEFLKHTNNGNYDIIVGQGIKVINEKYVDLKEFICPRNNQETTGLEFFYDNLVNDSMHMMVWLYLYKRKFLLDNNLYFEKGILHEDEEFTPRALIKASKLKLINNKFYYYIIRENSITSKKDKSKNRIDMINTCHKLEKQYDSICDEKTKKILKNDLARKYLFYTSIPQPMDRESKKAIKRTFAYRNAFQMKIKLRSIIFYISPTIYNLCSRLVKRK